jgi:fibronectin-binding autotransporter adhesin
MSNSTLQVSLPANFSAPVTVSNLVVGGLTNFVSITSVPAIYTVPASRTLIKYSTLTGTLNYGALLPSTNPPYAAYITNNTANKSVDLVITGGPIAPPIVWTAATDTNWDATTTNWVFSGTPTNYTDNGQTPVQFDDTSASGLVNVTTTFQPANVTVTNSAKNYTFGGVGGINGTGGINKIGGGTLTLDNTGANSFTGPIIITGGTIQIGNNDTSGNIPTGVAVNNNGTLIFNRTDIISLNNNISGLGTLVTEGSGTVSLTAANSYGATVISNGVVDVADGGTLGNGPVTNLSGSTLNLNHSDTLTVANVIIGSGTVTKNNSGTINLTGANNYSGATLVNSGALFVNGANSGSGAITNVGGSAIGGGGSIGGPADVMGALIVGATNTPGTFTAGGVTLESGATMSLVLNGTNLTAGSGINSLLQDNGGLTLNGNSIAVTVVGAPATNTSYQVVNFTGSLSGTFSPAVSVAPPSRYVFTPSYATAHQVKLVVSGGPASIAWNSPGDINWNVNSSADWTNISTGVSPDVYFDGDSVSFLDIAGVQTNINVATTVSPNGVTFNSTTNYFLNGPGHISGTNGVVKSGTGLVALGMTNDFTGSVVVNGGTLALTNGNGANTGIYRSSGVTINNTGTLLLVNDNALMGSSPTNIVPVTINAGGVLTGTTGRSSHLRGLMTFNGGDLGMQGAFSQGANGAWDLDGGVATAGGATTSTISAAGVIPSQTGGTIFNITNGSTASGIDLNVTGTLINGTTIHDTGLIKTNNGTLELSGINTYAGQTMINGGVIRLNNTNAAQASTIAVNVSSGLQFGTGITSFIVGGLTGSNNVGLVDVGSSPVTLQVGNNNTVSMYNGVLSGAGTLAKIGTSALILTASNTYTGPTLVNAGSLVLTNSGSIIPSTNITVASAGTFDASPLGTFTVLAAQPITNSGTVTVGTAGTLALSANATLVNSNVVIAKNLNTASGSLVVDNGTINANVTVSSGATLIGNGSVSSNLTVNASGTISPGAANATIGTLSAAISVSLSGQTFMEINKANGAVTNDEIAAAGPVIYGGTLNVTNIGPALQAGDTYKLFSSGTGSPLGNFTTVNLANPGAGLVWYTNNLTVDGTLSVSNAAVTNPTTNANITRVTLSGTNVVIHGTNNNVPNTSFHYVVLTTANITNALSNWTPVVTNPFNPDGTFDYTNPIVPATPRQFIDVEAVP